MELRTLQEIEENLSKRLNHNNLKLRNAGKGLWVSVLIPFALLCDVKHFVNFSELYKSISIISIGLLINSICDMLQNSIPYIQIGYIFSSTIVSLLLILFTNQGLIYSLCIACITSLLYNWTLIKLIKSCPRSFTYGEITLITQSLILYLCSYFTNILLSLFSIPTKKCDEIATFILQSGFFAVFAVILLAFKFSQFMQNIKNFLGILCFSFLIFVVFIPFLILRRNSLIWMFQLIHTRKSVFLVLLWFLCSLVAVFYLIHRTKIHQSATSSARKNFHFLLFLILMSGFILHPCLMYIASGIGFTFLVITEMCRKLKVTPYSVVLQNCFEIFKDKQDEGEFALTPIYLMIGCVVPLWIYPYSFSKNIPLPVLSGIFSIAVGDSIASISGSWFGKYKWQGSNKTVEGSVCCFVSQVLLLWILNFNSLIQKPNIIRCCLVFAVTSVIEAKTDQIDNLVLPFVTYILLIIN